MIAIQVRDRGQITLPKEIRAAYHLDAGTRLLLVPLDDERFEVRVIPTRRSIFELMDLYTQDGEAPNIDAAREALGDTLYDAIRTGGARP